MATLSSPPTEQEHTPRATALGGVFFWGAVTLLLVGILAYLFIGYAGVGHFTDADAKRVLERQKILQDRQAEDYKYLHDKPGWFKKDAGLIRVPIAEAMAMTLPALQANKPHPAYPIAQSPPQNAAAPTSPDKGAAPGAAAGPGKTNDINPAASNPTVGQPSPTPAASPAASSSPSTAPTPVPLNTPVSQAGPAASNNSNNPGNPSVPGTRPEPSAAPAVPTNTSGAVPSPTPAAATGAQPAPLTNPPGQPTPEATATPASAATTTPTPNPQAPGASPAGTP